jgi:hypothetical protein
MGEEEKLREELHALEDEHKEMDAKILALSSGSDQLMVQRLKKRKLWLKDRIAMLNATIYDDIIA